MPCLHYSNRLDRLIIPLARELDKRNPFETAEIVVPNFSLEKWISLKLAQYQGIAANLSFITLEKAIYKSCKIKKNVVEKDEKEKGLRKILNFGHTFAHAYEATLGYSKKLNHGEAVILGIKSATKFSFDQKLIKKIEYDSIVKHINNIKQTLNIQKYFSSNDLNKILSFMIKDKKNNSERINLILLKKIGITLFNNRYDTKKLKKFLKRELIN